MAQGTPDLADHIPAGSRLLEHRPVGGGGNVTEEACALRSGPQAKMSRFWDFPDFDQAPQNEPVNVEGPIPSRGGAAAGSLIADARIGPTGMIEAKSSGPSRCADDLTEADIGNLTAVLDHEIARNTMKNYRVQWSNFTMWAVGKGIRALPADPRHRSPHTWLSASRNTVTSPQRCGPRRPPLRSSTGPPGRMIPAPARR